MYTLLFPNLKSMTLSLPSVIDSVLAIEYKKILLSLSYIYYVTIFFMLTRVLVYFGLMLINLINARHSTLIKQQVVRNQFGVFLKSWSTSSFRTNFIKVVMRIYL